MWDIITWNMHPTLFHWGWVQVRWYGLFFALSFVWGNWFLQWVFKRENKSLESGDKLLIYIVVATIVGARLGHTLFYEPGYYLSNPIEILKIWKGGLASHGAGISILLALYLFTRSTPGFTFFWVLDRMAVATVLGAFLIRMGNFFNSEILGKPTNADWGIIFQRVDSIPRHPAMLYESFAYLLIFIVLMLLFLKSNLPSKPGALGGFALFAVFSTRFLVEFVKEQQVAFESGMILNMGQLLSIPLILLGIALFVFSFKNKTPLPQKS